MEIVKEIEIDGIELKVTFDAEFNSAEVQGFDHVNGEACTIYEPCLEVSNISYEILSDDTEEFLKETFLDFYDSTPKKYIEHYLLSYHFEEIEEDLI